MFYLYLFDYDTDASAKLLLQVSPVLQVNVATDPKLFPSLRLSIPFDGTSNTGHVRI